MPLENYVVRCYTSGCGRQAVYKIAAHWSDGVTSELKTYALSCAECLAAQFQHSCVKQAACRTTAGEILAPPGIYQMQHGHRDQQLERRLDLEHTLTG